jgi:hypothetical protein
VAVDVDEKEVERVAMVDGWIEVVEIEQRRELYDLQLCEKTVVCL